jgi:putative two-component system response regulator
MYTSKRVLAVDDNPINLAVIEEALQGQFQLQLARDGNEALRVAPEFRPDVVLLDVMMPRPDGYEVCSRMRHDHSFRRPQIFLVSAKTDADSRLRGYLAGADDYISKPFNEQELFAKVCVGLRTRASIGSMQSQLDELCGAAGETLELLTLLRDAETGEHIDRMRHYSQALAEELQIGPWRSTIDGVFLDNLYRASPLHDVGKVVISDAILRKPAPLSEQERIEMQQHTILGERILLQLGARQPDVAMFRMAAQIARSHHENFDGTGYPDGLRGDAIPLAARIVKVADVFDAVCSARVYKPSYGPQRARDVILCGKGTEFDPTIVDAMVRVFDRFLQLSVIGEPGPLVGLAPHRDVAIGN